MERWTEVNGIYQIYPRSFMDTNGDGVGDINGIRSRLDYIKGGEVSLGVDAIWLSPFYPSPMKDFGYDVSDYRGVDPLFGSLEDFDQLIADAHERNILVMIDFVPNHTSSEHEWFVEALKGKDNPYRDYYVFRDPSESGGPPNNWLSVFGGSAWEYDAQSGQYYMHSFLKEQPDLNWENPAVQDEMRQILRFWFERGVDGIRADAIRWMGKNTEFLDDPLNDAYTDEQDPYHSVRHRYSRFSPELDGYLKIITDVAEEYDNKIIIFEDHLDALTPLESQVRRIYSIDPMMSAPFNFQGMHIDFSARSFSEMINDYQGFLPDFARAFYCFSNHDESRLVSRFGEREARALAVLQLTLPGTPVIYYGQELGMADVPIAPGQIQDPFEKRVPNKGLGRDPQRTPMQWDGSEMAGFTHAERSWLPVSETATQVNVAKQSQDETSSLALYRKLLDLRREYPALQGQSYEHAFTDDEAFVFFRPSVSGGFLAAVNFSQHNKSLQIPAGGKVLISAQSIEYDDRVLTGGIEVAPLDAVVIQYE